MQANPSRGLRKTGWVLILLAIIMLLGVIVTRSLSSQLQSYDVVYDRAGNATILAGEQVWLVKNGESRRGWRVSAPFSQNAILISDGLDGFFMANSGGRQVGHVGPGGVTTWQADLPVETRIRDLAQSGSRLLVGTDDGIWVVDPAGGVEGRFVPDDAAPGGCGRTAALSVSPQGYVLAVDLQSRSLSWFDTKGVLIHMQNMDCGAIAGAVPLAALALSEGRAFVAAEMGGHPVLIDYQAQTNRATLVELPVNPWGDKVKMRAVPGGALLCDPARGFLWRYDTNEMIPVPRKTVFADLPSSNSTWWRALYRVFLWAAFVSIFWALVCGIGAWRSARSKSIGPFGVWALLSPLCGIRLFAAGEPGSRKGAWPGVILCTLAGLLIAAIGGWAVWQVEPARVAAVMDKSAERVKSFVTRRPAVPHSPYETYLYRGSADPAAEAHYRLAVWYLNSDMERPLSLKAAAVEISKACSKSGSGFSELCRLADEGAPWPGSAPQESLAVLGTYAFSPSPWLSPGEGEIHVVPVGPVDKRLMNRTIQELSARLNRPCVVASELPIQPPAFDITTGHVQSSSTLHSISSSGAVWTFALVPALLDTKTMSEMAADRRTSLISLPAVGYGSVGLEKVAARLSRLAMEHLSAVANAGWGDRDHKDCTAVRSGSADRLDAAVLELDSTCRQRIETLLDLCTYLETRDRTTLGKIWMQGDSGSLKDLARSGAVALWNGERVQALEILSQAGSKDRGFGIVSELLAATRNRLNGNFAEPDYSDSERKWAAALLYNWAEELSVINPEEAMYWAERSRRLKWPAWQVDVLCGRACMQAGAPEQAFLYFSKAIQESGGNSDPIMLYTISALQAGETSQAMQTLRKMTLGEPGRRRAAAWMAIGAADLAQKEYDRAATAFRKAAELSPDWPAPYAMLQEAWTKMGLIRQAEVAGILFQRAGGSAGVPVWSTLEKVEESQPSH